MAKALDYIMGTASLFGGDKDTEVDTPVQPASKPVASTGDENKTNVQTGAGAAPAKTTAVDTAQQGNVGVTEAEDLSTFSFAKTNDGQDHMLNRAVEGSKVPAAGYGLNDPELAEYAALDDEQRAEMARRQQGREASGTSAQGTVSPVTGTYGIDPSMWEDDEETKAWQAKQDAARMDILKALEDEAKSIKPAETEEERKKREKRERMSKVFSAIGDGISALSNLYFTTQGAPNMYTGENTLSARNQERIDRLKKEREGDSDRRLAIYQGIYKTVGDAITQRRAMKREQISLMMQVQKAQADAEAARQRAKVYEAQGNHYAAQVELEKARVAGEEADAAKKKAEAKKAEEQAAMVRPLAQSTIARNAAAGEASRASAANSRASAGEHYARTRNIKEGKDSSSKPVGYVGDTPYYNQADLDAAIYGYAEKNKIPTRIVVRSSDGITEKTTTQARSKAAIHAAVNSDIAAKKAKQGRFSSFSIHKNKK